MGRERLQEHPQQPPHAVDEDADADREHDHRPQPVGQELEAGEVVQLARGAGRRHLPEQLADDERARERQQQLPQEDDDEPAADPGARPQPAAQAHEPRLARTTHRRSSSRCQTRTGPRPSDRRSVATRSAMATDRWMPPVQPMAVVRRALPSAW